jgi:putative N6-adenine-specific DNA methylase
MANEHFRFFAPCPRGLEQVLAEELKVFGAHGLSIRASGVQFEGDRACGYRANLHSRIASRILCWLGSGRVREDDDVYRIARRQHWADHFDLDKRLRVDLSATRARARSIQFLTLRIKDGIIDCFRDQTNERPSIDTVEPDVRIVGHLDEDSLNLYIDWSGESLFKRGWRGRDDKGEAPLKENLAAGLVLLSQWRHEQALVDLFCGSGTILIEAAQMRFGIAAGIQRTFGFEVLNDYNDTLWRSICDEARTRAANKLAEALKLPCLLGSDIDQAQIDRAKRNALAAGLPDEAISWRCADAFKLTKPDLNMRPEGYMLSNPPYGERIEASGDFMQGRSFRDRWPGFTLCVFSAQEDLASLWRMKPKRKTTLMNGAIPCRLFVFPLYAKAAQQPNESAL